MGEEEKKTEGPSESSSATRLPSSFSLSSQTFAFPTTEEERTGVAPMRGKGGWGRDWDAAMREVSSGSESDEHDVPNILSLQKNAHRIAQLARQILPVEDVMAERVGVGAPPAGMRDASILCGGHARASTSSSRRSHGSRASRERRTASSKAAKEVPREGNVSRPAEVARGPPPPPREEEGEEGGVLV